MRNSRKPKKFAGQFANSIFVKSKEDLLLARSERKKETINDGVSFGLAGSAIGAFGTAAINLLRNPSFIDGFRVLTGGAVIVGLTMGVNEARKTYKIESKKIKRATHLVGKALCMEVRRNTKLADFLQQWKYVFVNSEGEIVGSRVNVPKLFKVGYIRLESKKILEGFYQMSLYRD